MRSMTTSYPHGSPWMTLSILTNSATISLPPVFWFTRSTNAGGKLPSCPKRIPIFFIIASRFPSSSSADLRQIMREHVAPVIPIVPAPSPVIEPMLDAFRVQDLGEAIRFMPGIVPFARADDDAHVVVFPRVGRVRQVIVGAVEINVVVVIAVEERTDVERAAEDRKSV